MLSLLPDCDVHITDWHNARDIPVSAGKFDIEDYTLYLVDFLKAMGPDTHVTPLSARAAGAGRDRLSRRGRPRRAAAHAEP